MSHIWHCSHFALLPQGAFPHFPHARDCVQCAEFVFSLKPEFIIAAFQWQNLATGLIKM